MYQLFRHFMALPTALILSSVLGIFSPTVSKLTAAPIVAQTPPRSFLPLPAIICSQLGQEMTNVLRVRVNMTRVAFQDSVSGTQGTACQFTATGNGRNFAKVSEVVRQLSEMLTKQGWSPVMNYTADGPTAGARGFRKGNGLAVFNVEWEPAPGVQCPENQPISACQMSPEQQIYRITLNAARQ
jgi:hypothetical protein